MAYRFFTADFALGRFGLTPAIGIGGAFKKRGQDGIEPGFGDFRGVHTTIVRPDQAP
jgi:hypothetical protein